MSIITHPSGWNGVPARSAGQPARLSPVHRAHPELLFAVPPGDESKFFATHIPWEGQQEINKMLATLRKIDEAGPGNVIEACRRLEKLFLENRMVGGVLRTVPRRGYSWERLRKHYYNYVRAGGDWRVLWNKTKYPEKKSGLPSEFIQFWKKLCEQNQRGKCAAAHRELMKIWRTHYDSRGKFHEKIPGYETWPEPAIYQDHPEGWSYDNLVNYKPDKFEMTAATIGRSAAASLRLPVIKTRVGLRVGEYIQFDDHEYNVKVNFPGQWRAMRPRGFTAADVLSGCFFKHSLKPTLWDESEEKKKTLTERDMMWFVIAVLTDIGFRADERGTRLIVEHGTAAIRTDFEQRINDVTGGKVIVERSGKFGRPAHRGQYDGRSHGNFRFKALIESGFNIVDNYLASLTGQVGMDRLHAPEQLHGQDRYNNKLLKAAANLPPERAALLKFPFMLWHEFVEQATAAYHEINTSIDHRLEGWDRLKFYIKEWRKDLQSPWQLPSALLSLPETEQQQILAALESAPELTRSRRLSRLEVFNAGRNELVRVPAYELPRLVGYETGFGIPVTVRSGLFEFQDRDISPDPLRYIATDATGKRLAGEYLCFVNPFNPIHLVATDGRRVVAVCEQYVPACYNDEDAIIEQVALQNQWEARQLEDLRTRHAPEARELEHMRQHNAAILAGDPATAEERRAAKNEARAIKRSTASITQFLGSSRTIED